MEELRLLKEKTHKDLWTDDLEAFLSELDVSTPYRGPPIIFIWWSFSILNPTHLGCGAYMYIVLQLWPKGGYFCLEV